MAVGTMSQQIQRIPFIIACTQLHCDDVTINKNFGQKKYWKITKKHLWLLSVLLTLICHMNSFLKKLFVDCDFTRSELLEKMCIRLRNKSNWNMVRRLHCAICIHKQERTCPAFDLSVTVNFLRVRVFSLLVYWRH